VVLSPAAWKDWYAKIRILNADAHANTVSLQALIAGETVRPAVLAARRPLIWLSMLGFSAAIALAARKKPLHQGAVASLLLLPVLMNPSNYYLHLVCFYPLLVIQPLKHQAKQPDAWPDGPDHTNTRVVMILLAMCASHYFAVMVPDRHIHFYQLSVSIVVGLAAVLFVLLRRDAPSALAALSAGPSPALPAEAQEGDEDEDEGDEDEDEDEDESDGSGPEVPDGGPVDAKQA
jgi:hypothetical protein